MKRLLTIAGVLALAALLIGPTGFSRAQTNSRIFPETNQAVQGLFLDYWTGHGGLTQQGYPISAEIQEKSDLNGQMYTVQYFERAVFELHPENQAPYNVLLSQLGTFRYKAKYGDTGAPGQQVSADNPRYFEQTKHTVGGLFRTYWETHGGLTQQGYPISDEFQEKSDLNGQTYLVQYFERAVFEYHPENKPPYNVLLSQLGTFQHKIKYESTPTPVPPTATPAPTQAADPCGDVPAAKDATIAPRCGAVGTRFNITITGFQPGEQVSFWLTAPDGRILGTNRPLDAGDHNGTLDDAWTTTELQQLFGGSPVGTWQVTYQGARSAHQSVVWFKVLGESAQPPPTGSCDTSDNKNGSAEPSSVKAGQPVTIRATGFRAGETVAIWFSTPSGVTVYTSTTSVGAADSEGNVGPLTITIPSAFSGFPGRWSVVLQGKSSGSQAVIHVCISP